MAELEQGGAPIYVTRSFVPPQEEYLRWVRQALDSHVLTNNGPIHKQLEAELRERLGAQQFLLIGNGTVAIQLALRALDVKGKVITTPFSYVATVSAILWEGCTPVFADIDPRTLCIDPARIEELIDADTTAILATHVFGIPCDVEAIEAIAQRHGLKVIYDGAHAFAATYKGRPLVTYGDACTLSFHATKLFHTVEGGAVVMREAAVAERMRLLRSFGHFGDEHFILGINGKMSEMHAAMGMAVLPHVDWIVRERARVVARYDRALAGLPVVRPEAPAGTVPNHAYYPVILSDGATRERVHAAMAEAGIFTRRYFFPSLNTLPYVVAPSMPVSEDVAARVLCLPLYPDLSDADTDRVLSAFVKAL